MKKLQKFTENQLEDITKICKALGHFQRIAILNLLDNQRELNVTYIYTRLSMDQAVVSRHLSILKNANLVKTRREGKVIFYSLSGKNVAMFLQLFDKITK